ncbi:MAG: hypothetical protein EHM58_18420 [Ignavibacteriae bacterium]|nr:MAG: hypothetical protein EHM58_18420 [Ignavibacteriota bacterium]
MKLLRSKFNTPRQKLAFVLAYILLISLFDSYTYGIVYQQKMANNQNYINKFTVWLFEEQKSSSSHILDVPNYRMLQKTLEIGGLIAVFYFCGFLPAIGILLSHYFMSYDLLFYIILKQTQIFSVYEMYNNTYWLQNWFQAGYYFLNPFDRVMFYTSGFAGIALAITLCFVKVRKKTIPVHKL